MNVSVGRNDLLSAIRHWHLSVLSKPGYQTLGFLFLAYYHFMHSSTTASAPSDVFLLTASCFSSVSKSILLSDNSPRLLINGALLIPLSKRFKPVKALLL